MSLAPLPCLSPALAAYGGRQPADLEGDAVASVVVTNIGTAACQLTSAPPPVGLFGTEGVVGVEQLTGTTSLSPMVVAPGGSATLTLAWTNWCGSEPGTLQILLGWPDGSNVHGPFDGPPFGNFVPSCLDRSQPSSISVQSGWVPGA